jgi:hypothetical protein
MNKDICLIVFAPVYGPSGYAKLSRDIILGLDALGVKIKLEPNRLWEPNETVLKPSEEERLNELERTVFPMGAKPIKLNIGIAPWFDKEYNGYKIGYTMFEFTNIPNFGKYDWKKNCSAMDEVWVPSQYNYRTFNDNGINNVFVMPPGIDIKDFNPNKEPLIDRKDGKFRFIAVGEYTTRKGWDLLIPAYLSEFDRNDDVTLIIKTYSGSKRNSESKRIVKEDIIKYRSESPNVLYPNILFIGDIISNNRLPNLYNSADCFILLTRGEGFGLPMAEAMACGKPCILPNNSSYLDFVNNENGYLVDTKGSEKYNSLHKASVLYRDSYSPIIDVNHARRIMRYIYNNREDTINKGIKAREMIESNFRIEQSILRMYQRLQELNIYFNNNKIDIVTDNFEELVLESHDIVRKSENNEELLNINIKNNVNITDTIMVIPTWAQNCGIADYTKRLVDNLNINNNILIVQNIFNLVDIVKKNNIKLVHIQHHYSFYNTKRLIDIINELKKNGCKVIMTVHDYASINIHNECLKYCDCIIVHSNFIKNKMIEDNLIDKKNIEVIIMGTDQFYDLEKNTGKKSLSLENKFIVSSFGFLHPHKNWKEVIKAISILKKDIPNILYLLMSVDKEHNTIYNKSLDTLIFKLGINDNVKRFSNFLTEDRVLQTLASSDAIVLPYSNYKVNNVEYYGVSIASRFAIRVKRPLIISNSSFFSDLNDISYVVKEPTAEYIAEAIINIHNDENLERKILLNQNNFSTINSWDNFKNRTIQIYLKILKGI